MKKLERQGAMKDRQISIKWTTSRKSSKELVISGPLELGKKPEWSSLGSDGPQIKKEFGGSMRRDPRRVSEGPRSRSLDARNLDGLVQQRHVNSAISRDISQLSESKRRLGDSLPKDGEGNLVLHELFKREFIEKLSERCKQREPEGGGFLEDFARPENFVKPIKIHARHVRSESADSPGVGSPKRGTALERVRAAEAPRAPGSPRHEKLRSPSLKEKFADPEWMSKCEKLNVDHQDQLDNHHRRSLSSADGETSRDFMLSKFFERSPSSSATSKASPRELYDLLSNEEMMQQDHLWVDVLPSKPSVRGVARNKPSLLVDDDTSSQRSAKLSITQGSSPFSRILAGDEHRNSPSSASTTSSRGEFGSRLAPLPPPPDSVGSYENYRPGTLVESLSKPPSRRTIEERMRKWTNPVDYNSEELARTKEAMLKSLREAAAVDQAHFLRTLQDQGAVQSSSPLRTPGAYGYAPEGSPAAYARSPSRAPTTDLSTLLKSPRRPGGGANIPKPPGADNVREVRGNAVDGSGARAGRGVGGGEDEDKGRWQAPGSPVELSASTQSSKIAARRRRSGGAPGEDSPIRPSAAESVGRADVPSPNSSSSGASVIPRSSVLQKIEKSRLRRRRRAEKEAAAAAAAAAATAAESPTVSNDASNSEQQQQQQQQAPAPEPPETEAAVKVDNSASRSWKIDNSASRSWNLEALGLNRYAQSSSNNEAEDEVKEEGEEEEEEEEVKQDVKQSIIQKLMRRASARAGIAPADDGAEAELAAKEAAYAPFAYHLPPPVAAGVDGAEDPSVEGRAERFGPHSSSSPNAEAGVESVSRNRQRLPSPAPSPKSDDPGPLKSPLSSIESSSNAQDLASLLADLTGSVGLALGSSPTREASNEAANNSLRVHVRNGGPEQQQQTQEFPESERPAQKSEAAADCRPTAERTLSAPGLWSPGSDDSGSDGSSVDNQPSPVSVLNNSRTPFAEHGSQIGELESRINQLDQKLQESQERSQKFCPNVVSHRRDGSSGRVVEPAAAAAAPVELMNQEVIIVELNPEGAPLRKSSKSSRPAAAAPAKLEAAKPPAAAAAAASNHLAGGDRYKGASLGASGYGDHRRSREIGHGAGVAAAVPVVGVGLGQRGGSGSHRSGEHPTDFRRSLEIIAGSASDFRKSLEIFDLENIAARGKRRWDLVYARDVLVASGFGRDVPSGPMTKWHSVAEPIDPSLFEKMEDYYKSGIKFLGCERLRRLAFYQPDHLRLAERIKASVPTKQGRYDPMHRCHLFDVVNELLAKKLGPYRTPRNPWIKPAVMRPRPTGKMLLEEIWRDICDQFGRNGSINDDQKLLHWKLENLIGEDLYKRSHWFPSPDFDTFIERIVGELEKRIFHDLVLETVATLQSI
ncbi:hypothetical protein MPTK1_8g14650 [Marchantia polymorpha subsp. ruderalis]|nr:hypothetical protein MARPO_0151s0041 [Marchantia polymorpha]BBN19895.1 hypothetical protein Mp_8g14650 [Marchantia polymorpha subsp. ruderalis]|eukprot:PTQ28969.1 hypothetical protein MARPO_0151s0041 [Marchantia polymorpha]